MPNHLVEHVLYSADEATPACPGCRCRVSDHHNGPRWLPVFEALGRLSTRVYAFVGWHSCCCCSRPRITLSPDLHSRVAADCLCRGAGGREATRFARHLTGLLRCCSAFNPPLLRPVRRHVKQLGGKALVTLEVAAAAAATTTAAGRGRGPYGN